MMATTGAFDVLVSAIVPPKITGHAPRAGKGADYRDERPPRKTRIAVNHSDRQDEIHTLKAEIARLQGELEAREREIATLKTMVDQDMLLPLLNRRAFEREFTRAWSAAKRYNYPVSLIYLDLNNMKQINDELGHDAGDKALRSVAKVLRDNCRQSDLTGRLGGDEFGVVMVQADTGAARRKAAELAQLVADTRIKARARQVVLSVSYGVAGGAGDGPVSAIIRTADRRMYEMKQSGGQVSPDYQSGPKR